MTVSGINDGGQIVGTVTGGGVGQGFVWKGSLHLLDVVEAVAINDQGAVLGTNANLQNVLWENGRMKRVGLGFVSALNDRGQVLGCNGPLDVDGYCLRALPALWTNGMIRVLPFDSE